MKTLEAFFNPATNCVQVRYGNKTWCLSLDEARELLEELQEAVEDGDNYPASDDSD